MIDLEKAKAEEILEELQEMREKIESEGRKPNDFERDLAQIYLTRFDEKKSESEKDTAIWKTAENYNPTHVIVLFAD